VEETNKTEETVIKKLSQQQSEEDTKKQSKPTVELQEETKPESPKEVFKAEDIKWEDDINFEQEAKQDITQAATTQEPIPTQEETKKKIKTPTAELGKESALPESLESQSAQYEELSHNAVNVPETKAEGVDTVEQTGISAPQNVEAVEVNTEVVQQEAMQDEGQTERGGDNAEVDILETNKPEVDLPEDNVEELKRESDVDSVVEEKNEVVSSPSITPEVKRQSPVSELLLSMEQKLEEEKMRVHELELENQECNPFTKDR
jgi:hypothetical protein